MHRNTANLIMTHESGQTKGLMFLIKVTHKKTFALLLQFRRDSSQEI